MKPNFKKSPEVSLRVDLDGEFDKIMHLIEYAKELGISSKKVDHDE